MALDRERHDPLQGRGVRVDAARRPATAGLGRSGRSRPGAGAARHARPVPPAARAGAARVPVRAGRECSRDPRLRGDRHAPHDLLPQPHLLTTRSVTAGCGGAEDSRRTLARSTSSHCRRLRASARRSLVPRRASGAIGSRWHRHLPNLRASSEEVADEVRSEEAVVLGAAIADRSGRRGPGRPSVTVNGFLSTTDPKQHDRLFRDGVPSDCHRSRPNPGLIGDATPRPLRQVRVHEHGPDGECVHVRPRAPVRCLINAFAQANSAFVPSDPSAHYLGDAGAQRKPPELLVRRSGRPSLRRRSSPRWTVGHMLFRAGTG